MSTDKIIPYIPIVAATGNANDNEVIACKEAGMDDYLCKPIDFDVLKNKLDEWTCIVNNSRKLSNIFSWLKNNQ